MPAKLKVLDQQEPASDHTTVGDVDVAAVNENIVRKKDLFSHVATVTGQKKMHVRTIVEATLEFLNQSLQDEKDVIVPPLGKITSKRTKVGTEKEKLVYQLNLRTADKIESDDPKETLAKAKD